MTGQKVIFKKNRLCIENKCAEIYYTKPWMRFFGEGEFELADVLEHIGQLLGEFYKDPDTHMFLRIYLITIARLLRKIDQ